MTPRRLLGLGLLLVLAWAVVSPAPSHASYSCPASACSRPSCVCASPTAPTVGDGSGGINSVPQLVVLTFDDAVTVSNVAALQPVIDTGGAGAQGGVAATSANGCPVKATFYVSGQYTDWSLVHNLWKTGHEIATHTITREIAGVKLSAARLARVPEEDVVGFRSPFLQYSWSSFAALKRLGMLYDSSITELGSGGNDWGTLLSRPQHGKIFPYSLDHGLGQRCDLTLGGNCHLQPAWHIPGLFEVPMWTIDNSAGSAVGSMDVVDLDALKATFTRHYSVNRAPMGLFYHVGDASKMNTIATFLEWAAQHADTYFVTNRQLIEWMKAPVSTTDAPAFFSCTPPTLRPGAECTTTTNCASGNSYMRVCGSQCPSAFPTPDNFDTVLCPLHPSLCTGDDCLCATPAIDCAVGSWGSWGACNAQCGGGLQHRNRSATTLPQKPMGLACPPLYESRVCNEQECPEAVHCSMTQWSVWGSCTSAHGCGFGQRTRTRSVATQPSNGGDACPTEVQQSEQCSTGPCVDAVDCLPGPWSAYSACTVTCGGGTQLRSRQVLVAGSRGGADCPALVQSQACNSHSCDTQQPQCSNCVGSSSGPCHYQGSCVAYEAGTTNCPSGTVPCEDPSIPFADCAVSPWTTWGACPIACGAASVKWRTRAPLVSRLGAGKSCPTLLQSAPCGDAAAPCNAVPNVDCLMTGWSNFTTCVPGQAQTRVRIVTRAASGTGAACNTTVESTMVTNCGRPVPCQTSPWSGWGTCACSASTGPQDSAVSAIQTRSRSVTVAPDNGGAGCPALEESRDCDTVVCGANVCTMGQWSAWSPCQPSSALQVRTRSRGSQEACSLMPTQESRTSVCAVDCVMAPWAAWGVCQCDAGHSGSASQSRYRTIASQPLNDGAPCGGVEESRACTVEGTSCVAIAPGDSCALGSWSDWGACSQACGSSNDGVRVATRQPVLVAGGAAGCGDLTRQEACGANPCIEQSTGSLTVNASTAAIAAIRHASPGDACGAPCWGASQGACRGIDGFCHARLAGVCPGGTLDCRSELRATVDCIPGPWTPWTACNTACDAAGGGRQVRSRQVVVQAAHGGRPCDDLVEEQQCNDAACGASPTHCTLENWGPWTPCVQGVAVQLRTRAVATQPRNGGSPCPDPGAPSRVQTRRVCPVDCQVSAWSPYHAAPGSAARWVRTRVVVQPPQLGGARCPVLAQVASATAVRGSAANCATCWPGTWGGCSSTADQRCYEAAPASGNCPAGTQACAASSSTTSAEAEVAPASLRTRLVIVGMLPHEVMLAPNLLPAIMRAAAKALEVPPAAVSLDAVTASAGVARSGSSSSGSRRRLGEGSDSSSDSNVHTGIELRIAVPGWDVASAEALAVAATDSATMVSVLAALRVGGEEDSEVDSSRVEGVEGEWARVVSVAEEEQGQASLQSGGTGSAPQAADNGGMSAGVIVIILLLCLLIAVVAIAAFLVLRRQQRGSGSSGKYRSGTRVRRLSWSASEPTPRNGKPQPQQQQQQPQQSLKERHGSVSGSSSASSEAGVTGPNYFEERQHQQGGLGLTSSPGWTAPDSPLPPLKPRGSQPPKRGISGHLRSLFGSFRPGRAKSTASMVSNTTSIPADPSPLPAGAGAPPATHRRRSAGSDQGHDHAGLLKASRRHRTPPNGGRGSPYTEVGIADPEAVAAGGDGSALRAVSHPDSVAAPQAVPWRDAERGGGGISGFGDSDDAGSGGPDDYDGDDDDGVDIGGGGRGPGYALQSYGSSSSGVSPQQQWRGRSMDRLEPVFGASSANLGDSDLSMRSDYVLGSSKP